MAKHGRVATKRQLRQQSSQPGLEAARKASRHIERGDFEQAFRAASESYRLEPTEERRALYERAHLLLAQQYERAGKREDCARLVDRLLGLGVTCKEVQRGLAPLLVECGMAEQVLGTSAAVETGPVLEALADQGVFHPEAVPSSVPQILAGAAQVREALEGLEKGDEGAAFAKFADTARTSPFADWKLFVRGLAAYYRGQWQEVRMNWQRLAPDRLAAKVAAPLLANSNSIETQTPVDPRFREELDFLEDQTLGTDCLCQLDELSSCLQERYIHDAIQEARKAKQVLARVDTTLPSRLTEVLYPHLIRIGSREFHEREGKAPLIQWFTGILEPLPLDPKWDRLWGLIEEAAGDEVPHGAWTRYANTVAELPALSRDERRLGEALVWKHLGDEYTLAAVAVERDYYLNPRELTRGRNRLLREAAQYFEKSRTIAPEHLPAHAALASVYERDRRQHKRVAGLYLEIAERFPDNVDALQKLFEHYRSNEPETAGKYLDRLRELRPLDERLRAQEVALKYVLGQSHARAGRFDAARDELAGAMKLDPRMNQSWEHWVATAVVEMKAGCTDAAAAATERALSLATTPAVVALKLAINGAFIKLPKDTIATLDGKLRKQLTGAASSEVVFAIAALFEFYVTTRTCYNGFTRHRNWIVSFLGRALNNDLTESACRKAHKLLEAIPQEYDLRNRYFEFALNRYPDSPYFLLVKASQEIDRGVFQCNRPEAMHFLRRALAAAEKSCDPEDKALVRQIHERMESLNQPQFDSPIDMLRQVLEAIEEGAQLPPKLAKIGLTLIAMLKVMGISKEEYFRRFADE